MTYRLINCLLAVMVSATLQISARNIQPQEALKRALQSEQTTDGAKHTQSVDKSELYKLAYSSPTGSYHVFNRLTGGYIVVSGDDEACPLLADVSDGVFSTDSVAPAAQSMLNHYDSQIQMLSQTNDRMPGLMDYYSEWEDIPALMTTKWNQNNPYNIYCPIIEGRTAYTGCVATAMAQVIRHIGYYNGNGYRSQNGVNYKGEAIEFDFGANTFDFDAMYDTGVNTTAEEIDQVGRLMLACGLSVGMGYGISGSAASSLSVPNALIDHFGYDSNHTRLYDHENYSQAEWEKMIYDELRLNRPIYYSGSNGSMGHAYVVDGYKTAGLYHINWGWGGMSDGYYRLNVLNPAQVGIGGGNGGYNLGQNMVFAVPPGAQPGTDKRNLYGSISYVGDNTFALYYKSLVDNVMDATLGALITDMSKNKVTEVTFWTNQSITANSALRSDNYSYDFSQLKLSPGEYRIYTAYRLNDGEYVITAPMSTMQHYVNLSVSDNGAYTFTNDPVAIKTIALNIPEIIGGYDLHSGFSGSFSFYAINNGNLDYNGVIKLTMLDNDGNEICRFNSSRATIAAGAITTVGCSMPVFDESNHLIPAGTYGLCFADSNDNILSDNLLNITIKDGAPYTAWKSEEKIEVNNCSTLPSILATGDIWPHTPHIVATQTHRNMTLRLAFYKPSEVASSKVLMCYQGNIESMDADFPIDPVEVDVPFGTYEVCYRKGYNQISQKRLIRIGENINGISYLPADGNNVSASTLLYNSSPTEIIIPSQITVGSTDLTVTEIEPEAFLANRVLEVIDLPSSIKKIGAGAFTVCSSLSQIILRAQEPPFTYRNAIVPGLSSATEFYVPASAYDKYRPLLEGYNPLYSLVESIESKTEAVTSANTPLSLSVSPAHEAINPAFIITPVDNASAEVAEVTVASVTPGVLNLNVKALRKGTATYHVYPAHRSDDYSVLTLEVLESAGIDKPQADDDNSPRAIYDLLGRPAKADNNGKSPNVRIIVHSDGKVVKFIK